MKNKELLVLLAGGAIFGGAFMHSVTIGRVHKLKHQLHNTEAELKVLRRWYTSAMKQMSVAQLFSMVEDAGLRDRFEKIVKNM